MRVPPSLPRRRVLLTTAGLAMALARIPSFTTEEGRVAEFLHALFIREGLQAEFMEVDPALAFR